MDLIGLIYEFFKENSLYLIISIVAGLIVLIIYGFWGYLYGNILIILQTICPI